MQDKKIDSLVPLESLNEKPIYKGSAIAEYKPEPSLLDDALSGREQITGTEGRKKKTSPASDSKKEVKSKKVKKEPVVKKGFSLSSLFSSISKGIDEKIKARNNDEDRVQKVIRDDKPEPDEIKETDKNKKKVRVPIFGKSNLSLEEMGYPRKVKIPVDVEILNGNKGLFFNVEKWLEFRDLEWIAKIIPIHWLDKLTYNKRIFDNMAPKLHDEAIEYNQMTAIEQMKSDKRRLKKRFFKTIGTVLALVIIIIMSVVPSYQSRNAMSLMRSGRFQDAYQAYDSINKPSELDDFYKQYSLAMGFLEAKNYKKAKEEILKMEGYVADEVDLNGAMNEILYQEAEELYKQGKYADAANNLKITYNYKDSKARFLEASYKSLDELMESENYEKAMNMLSLLGDYKNAEAIGSEYMEKLYQDAQEKYAKHEYSDAEKLFYYIAQNNYKDSRTMIYQAQYNAGLEYYKKKDYNKAIEQLSKISWFKDASAMLSNMYYTRGKGLIDDDPIKAYDNLVNCVMFRDTIDILSRPELVLFGEWQVNSYNGSAVSGVKLNFNFDGEFSTDNPDSVFIKQLKISDGKNSYKYKYKNDEYSTKKSDYSFTVTANDINNISLIIRDGDSYDELSLTRLKPIQKTNLDTFTSIRDSLYEYIDKQLGRPNDKE